MFLKLLGYMFGFRRAADVAPAPVLSVKDGLTSGLLNVTLTVAPGVNLPSAVPVADVQQGPVKVPCLPLGYADKGRKQFTAPGEDHVTVVSAGRWEDFVSVGPLSLPAVIAAVLSTSSGDYWHIGELPADVQEAIRTRLEVEHIAPQRFRLVTPTASLWDNLGAIDAHVFLGAFPHPNSGDAVVAQGCGYPVAFYTEAALTVASSVSDLYADTRFAWHTTNELIEVLRSLAGTHAGSVECARRFYEDHYSRSKFMATLDAALA